MAMFEVRDPVYGFIPFSEWEKQVIDHWAFQRLRRIRQLALTDLVYPSAMHTRFEHSLGVMHLATMMFERLVDDSSELGRKNVKILEEELDYRDVTTKSPRIKQLLRFAALLHDIGHAPFSHASEDEILPKKAGSDEYFKHEDYTIGIIRHVLKDAIEKHRENKTTYKIAAEEIIELIEGNPKDLGLDIFWKELISSQLDADRADYLLRDSYHLGVKYGVYDYQRLINTMALGKNPDTDNVVLGIHEDGWKVAETVVFARYQFFTQVCYHKTRRAYDYHLTEIFKRYITDELKINSLPEPTDRKNLEEYLKLDDYVLMNYIQNSDDEDSHAIQNRKHIRKIFQTSEKIKDEEREKLKDIKRKLDKNIWFYEDTANKVWYKYDKKDTIEDEIMIIDKEGKTKPLSEKSDISKALGNIEQTTLYVKEKDRKKAQEVIDNV